MNTHMHTVHCFNGHCVGKPGLATCLPNFIPPSVQMEEADKVDKGCPMIRMGVFLLVLAYPGSPRPKAIKRLFVCVHKIEHLTITGAVSYSPSCHQTVSE